MSIGRYDLGELSYQSTLEIAERLGGQIDIWEKVLITQTMAFATYFTRKGMLRNDYDIIPLR